jgi:hypothetical protein
MNCADFSSLTAWPCRQVRGALGEDVTVLAPPVPFWDGTVIPAYVFDRGNQFEVTDDGALLHHLNASGHQLSDKRRRRGLENAVAEWNVQLENDLLLYCPKDQLAYGLQRFQCALFAAARWELESAGKDHDDMLMAEAEMYLLALNREAAVRRNVPLQGISSNARKFPLALDETLYDAVGTHPASSASMVKKLFDVRSVRENADVPITIIVNDADHEKASHDSQMYSQLAHVEKMSKLRAQARALIVAH